MAVCDWFCLVLYDCACVTVKIAGCDVVIVLLACVLQAVIVRFCVSFSGCFAGYLYSTRVRVLKERNRVPGLWRKKGICS